MSSTISWASIVKERIRQFTKQATCRSHPSIKAFVQRRRNQACLALKLLRRARFVLLCFGSLSAATRRNTRYQERLVKTTCIVFDSPTNIASFLSRRACTGLPVSRVGRFGANSGGFDFLSRAASSSCGSFGCTVSFPVAPIFGVSATRTSFAFEERMVSMFPRYKVRCSERDNHEDPTTLSRRGPDVAARGVCRRATFRG